MSDLVFNCPNCGQSLEAPEELLGSVIECPCCKDSIQIPAAEDGQAESELAENHTPANSKAVRACPYCGEEIAVVAKKCKHCGEWLDESAKPKTVAGAGYPAADRGGAYVQDIAHDGGKSGCSVRPLGCLVAVVLGMIGVFLWLGSQGGSGGQDTTAKAEAQARAIIRGDNEVFTGMHQGFLMIDRAIERQSGSGSADDIVRDALGSGLVINKLVTAIGKEQLIRVYTEWCKQMGKTSYTRFPEVVEVCQRSDVKHMTDSITQGLTK